MSEICLDIVLVLIVYNTLFNKNIWSKIILHFIAAIVLGIIFEFIKEIDKTIAILIVLNLQVIYITIINKVSLNNSLIKLSIANVIVFIFHIIAYLLFEITSISKVTTMILCFICFIGLNKHMRNKNYDFNVIIEENIFISLAIINIFLFMLAIRLIIESGVNLNLIVLDIVIVMFLIISINISYYKKSLEIVREKKELKLVDSHKQVINELIENIRLSEHEYKNHLNTLYSMVQVDDREEIKSTIEEYMDSVREESNRNRVIYIDNYIVKAILFNKILECQQENLSFKYLIGSSLKNINISGYDLNIILSNLLNNAIESVKALKYGEVYIFIKNEKNLFIEIKNTTNNQNINTEEIFEKGITTKGNNRGYGLVNVKRIIEKYNGSIDIYIKNQEFIVEVVI